MDIHKTDTPPTIDGKLDDEVWQHTPGISDFKQVEPVEGGVPTEKTILYLTYDKDTIYVGIHCLDSNPDGILGRELHRDGDNFFSDDNITIAFDTFLDRRNAFMFGLNPVGAKFDDRFENNSSFRKEWDAIWTGEVHVDETGWSIEMAIPVKSITFDPSKDRWGVNVERHVRRKNEVIRWSNVSLDKKPYYVADFGDLMGIEGLDQGVGLDIKPLLAAKARYRDEGSDMDFTSTPGFEMIYKVTPTLNASLLVNPDFSDTTVDVIQTNLTRFKLFFPEQRDFFVRDADIFQFGGLGDINGQPYFSRRIGLTSAAQNPEAVDIKAGAKLSGRIGRYTLGLFNTQLGSHDEIHSKNLTVARATMDVLDESKAGVLFTYGNPFADEDNAVAGVDFQYRNSHVFGNRAFIADLFFLKSETEDINDNQLAYGLRLNYPNDIWNMYAYFTEIQENYNPALGFVNRLGIRSYEGQVIHRYRPQNSFIRSLDVGVTSKFTTNTDNELETSKVSVTIYNIENHDEDRVLMGFIYDTEELLAPFEIFKGVVIPVDDYEWWTLRNVINTSRRRPIKFELEWNYGKFYDGTKNDVIMKLTWRANRHLFTHLEHQVINVNLPHGHFDINLNRIKLDYNFTTSLSWTNFVQHENESDLILWQSQLRWIITPGNELTFTLNNDWRRDNNGTGSYISTESELAANIFWTKRY